MTHDELLAKVDAYHKICLSGGSDKDVPKSSGWSCYNIHAMVRTLRAVVELHKPWDKNSADGIVCWDCQETYPCETINAIKKELI